MCIMPIVRLYLIDRNNHIKGYPRIVECVDDKDAFAISADLLDGIEIFGGIELLRGRDLHWAVEIWEGNCLVGKVEPKPQRSRSEHYWFVPSGLGE
jgi:hypothetical protein